MMTAFIIWCAIFAISTLLIIVNRALDGCLFLGFLILALPAFIIVGAVMSADWGHCQDGYDTTTYEKC